jgi:RNA polymerase sigma-70 factor (ECF subfamily)
VNERIKDEALLENARHGDKHAFLLLYERHRNHIFRFLFRFLGSTEIAEDMTHDSFMTLVGGSESSQSSAQAVLRTRLYTIARTQAMEYVQNSAQEPVMNDIAQNNAISTRRKPNNETHDAELVSEVGKAVRELPPLEREVLIFSEYEGLELDQIAAIVGADVGTVVARLGIARQRLRNVLASHLFSNQ